MRRLAGALLALLAASPAAGGVVVLKDGRAMRIQGEARESGPLAVFQLEDGTWVSVRAEAVDWPATERAGQLLTGSGVPRAVPDTRPHGPQELESLEEGKVYGALVHTGRTRRNPGPEEEPDRGPVAAGQRHRMAGAIPPIGPPRPGSWALLTAPGPSPYVGDGGSGVEARARVAPLVAPAGPRPERAPVAPPPPAYGPPRPGDSAAVVAGLARRLPEWGFVSPRDGDAVLGSVTLEARPRAGGASLLAIEYRVDGALIGTVREAPWQASWRAPGDRAPHRLEARIERVDGSVEVARAQVLDVFPDAEVDVELVPLSVAVTNHEYLFVRDLGRDDFLVFEDGVRQEVAHFSREPTPLRILVAVDSSWSMNGRKMEMAAEALRRLVGRLGASDRVAVATFSESFHLEVPFEADRAAAAAGLDGIAADGGTAMLDAEVKAIDLLAREDGRRVLILVGDGEDYLSRTRLEDVAARAQRASVAVFAVGILTWRLKDGLPDHWADKLLGHGRPAYWTDTLRVRGLKILRRQTDATGGVLYLPKFSGELPYVFEHLLAELKSSYQLGYYPSNRRKDGRFRSIQVEVDGRGLVARTRKGYYAPGDSSSARR